MAEFGMTRVRIGLFQQELVHPEANSERFESIEAKLDELRSYLYANRESVRGYAEAYRNGERISTAHVESTVNQLINWRMCKKHQMGWSRAGAQYLLHVKTAIIIGRLDRYTGHHQHRPIWPPDPQVFAGLDLTAIDTPNPYYFSSVAVLSSAVVDLRANCQSRAPSQFSKHRDHSPIHINHLSVHEILSR